MDNFYEIVVLDDPGTDKKTKAEIYNLKIEKSPFAELHSVPANTHKKFSPESSKVNNEKQKIKQYIQSRTEIFQIESKVQPAKKNSEGKEERTNERINISKVPLLPLLSIRTNAIEESYKELKELKQNISDFEEQNKVNTHCIEINKIKIQELEDRQSALRKKAGLSSTVPEIREELQNKLKTIQKTWKNNTTALRKKIQDLEEEAKNLEVRIEGLKIEICRKREQRKKLTRNFNENSSNSEIGYHSCDMLNSSTQLKAVIRTPSWNNLTEN